MKWIWIILAIIYLLSPYDIIPGIHPAGWIDDIIILVLLFRYLSRFGGLGNLGKPPYGNDQNTHRQSPPNEGRTTGHKTQTPHEIIGVPSDADQNQIHAAYRKLANQYHPDKVAHLGTEFQTLAEQRFKEIQEAYDKLKIS